MKFALAVMPLAVALFGCAEKPSAPTARPTPLISASVLSAEKLRGVFPKVAPPLTVFEFRAKPGIVTKHVRREGNPIATLMVQDLLGDAGALKEFDGASGPKVHGNPTISTSMGGGVAVLAEGRFRVEVVALGPEVTDKIRSQWLEGFAWETLKGQAR